MEDLESTGRDSDVCVRAASVATESNSTHPAACSVLHLPAIELSLSPVAILHPYPEGLDHGSSCIYDVVVPTCWVCWNTTLHTMDMPVSLYLLQR